MNTERKLCCTVFTNARIKRGVEKSLSIYGYDDGEFRVVNPNGEMNYFSKCKNRDFYDEVFSVMEDELFDFGEVLEFITAIHIGDFECTVYTTNTASGVISYCTAIYKDDTEECSLHFKKNPDKLAKYHHVAITGIVDIF